MRPWDDILTETDREVIRRAGYGKQRGLGTRPCLVLIDCQYNHIGEDKPILEQLATYPSGGGAAAWEAARRVMPVVQRARAIPIPVIYTRFCYSKEAARYDGFALKRGNVDRYVDGAPGTRILKELEPQLGDLIIDKTVASAMFGTPLIRYLIRMGVDTLLIAGVSTGGCVRATAIDAVTYNFNVAVLEDCTADRIEASHKVALLDLWMKYTDVIPSQEALAYLDTIRPAAVAGAAAS